LTSAREHDALDEALDRLVQGLPVVAPEGLEQLLQTARAAREAFALEVPDDVARAHLALLSPDVVALERKRPRHRVVLVIAAAILTVGLLGTAAVAASASSLPGDILYPVKRAVEKVELSIHRDPSSRARLHLEYAQRRLAELSALLAERRIGQTVDVGAEMSAYRDEIAAAQLALTGDIGNPDFTGLLDSVSAQLQHHIDVLTALQQIQLPEPAQSAIENAIENANRARANVGGGLRPEKPVPGPKQTPSHPATPHAR